MLIETLYAIFLVMTAALIVSATMPIATVSKTKAQYEDKAMDLAQKQMEAIKALGFTNANANQLVAHGLVDTVNPVAVNTYPFTNSDSTNLDNPAKVLPGGEGTVQLTQLNFDLIQVMVTVSWSDHGVPESYTIGSQEALL